MKKGGLFIAITAAIPHTARGEEPRVTILDNGLTVITMEMHYAPVAASVITYRVGSRNETGDVPGISHFCEHLMFKGTPDMPKSRFWQIIRRDGGIANAFTDNDVTCYYLLLPSGRLEDALAIESDRMVNCTMDPAEVASERNVVHEERRMRSIDDPGGALREALSELAYTVHPYGNPVMGYDDNILAYNREKARKHYETYYCPSNAFLALVGDFDTDELLVKVRKYFGDIPPGNVPRENIPAEPEQTEPRYGEISIASKLPRFITAFHSVAGNDPDLPAVEIIASYLSGGRSGRLDEKLVNTGSAHSVWAGNDGGIDPGLFRIVVTMNPPDEGGPSMEEIRKMILEELENLAENGIPGELLEQLKNRNRASEILSRADPLGLAMDYSLSAAMFGDPMISRRRLEILETLTPEDISRVASSLFRKNGMSMVSLVPSEKPATAAAAGGEKLIADIREPSGINYEGLEIPDDFLTLPERSMPGDVRKYDMDNGLVLLVKEDHSFPVASVGFAVPMGGLRHPASLNGLAEVTAETMMHGTENLEYTEFHKRLEMKGSYLSFEAGEEYSTGLATLLSEDLTVAFATISDLLLRPAFREADFSKVMTEKYADLAASAERAFSVAYDNLAAITAATPEDHRRPSGETLNRITPDDVVRFHLSCCRPEGSVIAVSGDVNPDEVAATVEKYFGTWSNPNTPLPGVYTPEFSTKPGDTVVAFMRGKAQATILVARNAPGYLMPEYHAFETMNAILGGGIGSRLGYSIRDEQGLAYTVGTWTHSSDSTGMFIAYLSTLADYVPRALASVTAEMERMASEPVPEIELGLAKANAVGRYAFSGISYSRLANRMVNLFMKNRPPDYDIRYLEKVLRLKPEDIMTAAAKYFAPGEWFVSIAGGIAGEDLPSRQTGSRQGGSTGPA